MSQCPFAKGLNRKRPCESLYCVAIMISALKGCRLKTHCPRKATKRIYA